MKVLLVEDDDDKARKISEALHEDILGVRVEVARSFNSGLQAAAKGDRFDLLLLDMSMPNYDISSEDPMGGTPINLAGEDLLAQMRLRGIAIPTIVITMFDSFGKASNKTSIEQLEARLTKNYGGNFRGLVKYNLSQEGWRSSLLKLIRKVSPLG